MPLSPNFEVDEDGTGGDLFNMSNVVVESGASGDNQVPSPVALEPLPPGCSGDGQEIPPDTVEEVQTFVCEFCAKVFTEMKDLR